MGRKNKREDRMGEERYNNFGSLMKIVDYRNNRDIDVLFPEYNWVKEKVYYSSFIRRNISCPFEPTVYGIGYLGTGNAIVSINGKHTEQYNHWYSMLQRCHSEKYHIKQPSYIGCSVYEEWHNFQNFALWYNENYYEVDGEVMALDKDILVKGNKIYSPETCIFVPQKINSLFIKCDRARGELPIGVCKHNNKYVAYCSDTNKNKHLGYFDTVEEAFNAYKTAKENLIKEVANEYYNNNLIPFELYEAMYNYEVDIDD